MTEQTIMASHESIRRASCRTSARVFLPGLLALLLASPVPVRADAAKDKAKAAFTQGTNLFESGDYREAAKAFRSAYELSPHWKLLYNIAQCEAAAKNYGPALEAFESYMVSGGDEVPADRQDEVRREIARLRDLCGDVEIDAPPGSDVFVDDAKRGRTPIAGGIPVGAGVHIVRIVHGKNVLLRQEVQIRGAKTIKIKATAAASAPAAAEPAPAAAKPGDEAEPQAEPGPEPVPVDMPAAPEDLPPNRMLVLGSVLAAVGGATLIAGVVTGGVSRAKTKELEDSCPDKQCLDLDDETLHDQAAKLSLATDVLLPTGAAFAIAGTVLVILGLRGDSAEEPNVELTAAAGPEQVGVAFKG
ncbi:MAG TPA: tetratricopeptide repeat protein, partial [Polyangia bacterium]|nr:tetratricopeptide repeat protein [Polyangia bacterium]